MEGIRHSEYHVLLYLTQVELTIYLAVHTLASLSTYGDDSSIGLRLFTGYAALGYLDFIEFGLSLIQEPHHRILIGLQLSLGIFHVVLIDFCKLRSGSHTDVLQTCNHVYRITYINSTTTKAARHKVVRVDSEEGYCLQVANRQSTIVLQEHHTLCTTLTGNGSMSLEVGLATILITFESRSLHDVFKHTTHIAVNILNIQFTRFHRIYNGFNLSRITWHQQIIACCYLLFYRKIFTNTYPVGLNDSLESPVITQDVCQQIFVALSIDTVHLIIRRHDGPRIALTHHHLKALEIKFT